jgi:hypothetical protein
MRPPRCVALVALVLAPAIGPREASAGGPTLLEVAGERDLARGTLEGLTLGDDGVLRPGPSFDSVPLETASAWAAAKDDQGHVWVGTGDEGVLVRVAPDGTTHRFATGGRLVTAVAALPGGACLAAVFPGSHLVRATPDGKVERVGTLEARYVWALAPVPGPAEGGARVLAATGDPGAVFSVDLPGGAKKVADVLDDHARCLLVAAPDDLLVGTAGKGLVLRISGGRTRVLRDLDESEVVGLALVGKDVLVGANQDLAGGNVDDVASLLAAMTQPSPTERGRSPAPRTALQSGSVHRLEPDGVSTPLWRGERVPVLSLAPDGRGGAVAGTGASGRVLHVDVEGARILADLPQPEVSVVLAGPKGAEILVASNPAVLHRRTEAPPAGAYTSAPLDAGTTAAFGRVAVVGRGLRSPEVRGGETSEPDPTWTPWQALEGFDGTAGQARLTARRIQVRVRLEGPDAHLRRLEAVAQPGNHAPVVEDVAVARAKGASGAAGQREVTWRASDPDRDAVVTTVEVRREGSSRWVALGPPAERTSIAWETAGWPDGVYEVRVTASDEAANPPGRGRRARAVSGPVRIDNRAPEVPEARAWVEGGALRVAGIVADRSAGRVVSVEAAVDGGTWLPVGASDGMFDSPEERFEAAFPAPEGGGAEVVVRATDADGNRASFAVPVEKP